MPKTKRSFEQPWPNKFTSEEINSGTSKSAKQFKHNWAIPKAYSKAINSQSDSVHKPKKNCELKLKWPTQTNWFKTQCGWVQKPMGIQLNVFVATLQTKTLCEKRAILSQSDINIWLFNSELSKTFVGESRICGTIEIRLQLNFYCIGLRKRQNPITSNQI